MKAMAIQAKKIKNKLSGSRRHQENGEIVQNLDFAENRSSCLDWLQTMLISQIKERFSFTH